MYHIGALFEIFGLGKFSRKTDFTVAPTRAALVRGTARAVVAAHDGTWRILPEFFEAL